MDARIVVDASVLVSQLIPYDINHNPSLLWLNQFSAAGGLLVAPVFLQIEVATAISRLTGKPALVRKALDDLNNTERMDFVPLDSALVQTAIDVGTDLRLRAGDSIYVALARQLNIPLVSWDKEQLQRTANVITTYTPSNYVF